MGGPRRASFGTILIFSFGKNWLFPAQQLCGPGLGKDPAAVSSDPLVAAGSLQSLSRIGALTLISLQKGFPGPACIFAPHQSRGQRCLLPPATQLWLCVSATSSLWAGFSLLQGVLTSVDKAPSLGLPRPDPASLPTPRVRPPGAISPWQSGVLGELGDG